VLLLVLISLAGAVTLGRQFLSGDADTVGEEQHEETVKQP